MKKHFTSHKHFGKNSFSKRNSSFDPTHLINNQVKPVLEKKTTIAHEFSDFLISEQLKKNIFEKGYRIPTPIQDQTIPLVLEGHDIIGIANTGSGKTGSFLIPLINKVINNRSQKVLVIAPTRELAVQIEDELEIFSKNMGISSVLCIGGVGLSEQTQRLRKRHDFVIGTPGRLIDLRKQGKINLSIYNNVVLDEVDRMMDMGFIKDIKNILSLVPQNRQSLFFSATIPTQVLPIINSFLKNPKTVSVKSAETVETIQQNIMRVSKDKKSKILRELLSKDEFSKVLVFGRTKWGMEKLSKSLMAEGFKVAAIHGNKNQNQRQRALDQFRNNQIQALLATDVAARGLDIDDVTHVINYDAPASKEDYVHRIGRTGRANKRGIAITFVE